MKRLLLALLTLLVIDAHAQVVGQDAQGNVNDLAGGSMFRSFDNRFKGIEGYPTLVKAYCPGQIIMKSGKKVKYDSVNLDIYSNDLLVKRNNDISVFNRSLVKEFSIETDETTLTFVKLKNLEGKETFYGVLAGGKVKLLKHSYKTIAGPTNSGAYSSGRTYSIFEEKSKIYVQKESGELFELKNKKNLLSQFTDKEEEISKFMKNNRINLNNESESGKLIEFINTIL